MKTILCFGDSNTFGCLPIDIDLLSTAFVPNRYRLTKTKRWTSILQAGKKIATLLGCEFLNVGDIIKPSSIDGIHYQEKEHEKLGKTLVKIVKNML